MTRKGTVHVASRIQDSAKQMNPTVLHTCSNRVSKRQRDARRTFMLARLPALGVGLSRKQPRQRGPSKNFRAVLPMESHPCIEKPSGSGTSIPTYPRPHITYGGVKAASGYCRYGGGRQAALCHAASHKTMKKGVAIARCSLYSLNFALTVCSFESRFRCPWI